MFDKSLPMTGFEPRISGDGGDRSTNWATTTAPSNIGSRSIFLAVDQIIFLYSHCEAKSSGIKIIHIVWHSVTKFELTRQKVFWSLKAENIKNFFDLLPSHVRIFKIAKSRQVILAWGKKLQNICMVSHKGREGQAATVFSS